MESINRAYELCFVSIVLLFVHGIEGFGQPSTCPQGKYLSFFSCTGCGYGRYKTTTSTSVNDCLSCPTGSTTQSLISTSLSDCIAQAGYYGTASSTTEWQFVKACDGYMWTDITLEGTTYTRGTASASLTGGNPSTWVDACWNYCGAQVSGGKCLKIFVSESSGYCYWHAGPSAAVTALLSQTTYHPPQWGSYNWCSVYSSVYETYMEIGTETTQISFTACPAHTTSLSGATSVADCTALAGYYMDIQTSTSLSTHFEGYCNPYTGQSTYNAWGTSSADCYAFCQTAADNTASTTDVCQYFYITGNGWNCRYHLGDGYVDSVSGCTAQTGTFTYLVEEQIVHNVELCPTSTTSLSGATSIVQCTCNAGYEDLRKVSDSDPILPPGTNLARACGSNYNDRCATDARNIYSNSDLFTHANINDGDYGTLYHSSTTTYNWIQIDLGRQVYVEEAFFYNRPGLGDRIDKAFVLVSNKNARESIINSWDVWRIKGDAIANVKTFGWGCFNTCTFSIQRTFRYIIIARETQKTAYFNFMELEVYGVGGKSATTNIVPCVACLVNEYSLANSASCTSCPSNSYTVSTASSSCTASAGYYMESVSNVEQCHTSSTSLAGATSSSDCTCLAGFYASCVDLPGSQSGTAWSDGTNDCAGYEAGGFCAAYGSYQYPEGAANDHCCTCGGGQYTCTACGIGTFKAQIGNDACTTCPGNTLTQLPGSESADDCLCVSGYDYESSTGRCEVCGQGYYANGLGNDNCVACGQHKTTDYDKSTSIAECKCSPGYYSTADEGESACIECAVGTYQPTNANGVACTACSQGGTTITSASTTSAQCIPEAGFYQAGTDTFLQCAADTYRAYDNEAGGDLSVASCLACPRMANAPAGSVVISDCECTHAHTEGTAGTPCTCRAGYYEIATPCACANTPDDGWITLTGYAARQPWAGADGYDGPDVSRDSDTGSCELDGTVDGYEMLQYASSGPCHAWVDAVLQADAASTYTTLLRCRCPSRPAPTSGHTCEACPAGFFCPAGAAIHACPLLATSPENSVDLQSCACPAGSELLVLETNLGICVECAAGTYSNANTCAVCPLHTDSTAGSSSVAHCVANAGFYKTGDDTITACISHATSPTGSTSASDCVCLAGYFYSNSICEPCPSGTYKPLNGNQACTACPSNSHHTLTQQSSVESCSCNSGFTGLGTACEECTAGTYKTSSGSDACQTCGMHETSAAGSSSAASCVCAAGYSLHDGGCQACVVGTYKHFAGNTECSVCPSNGVTASTTSAAGSTQADDCVCPQGATGAPDTCSPCAQGTYKTASGSHACIACPENTLTTETGAHEFTACVCNAGFSASATGGTIQSLTNACSECEIGSYKASAGTSPCIACPSNADALTAGSTACVCNAGFDGNFLACNACAAGTYKAAASTADCTACHEFSTSNVGSTTSQDCHCNAGFAADGGTCTPCPENTYKAAVSNHITCAPCSTSSQSASLTASSSCLCNAGYSGSSLDGSDCSLCVAGTFKNSAGSAACTTCPDAQHSSDLPRTSSADCVCNAGYAGDGADPSVCSACGHSEFKDTIENTACTACVDSHHSLTASTVVTDCECNAGFVGAAPTCAACLPGQYANRNGNGVRRRRLLEIGPRGVDGHTDYNECIDGFQYVTYPGSSSGGITLYYNNIKTSNIQNYDATTNPRGKQQNLYNVWSTEAERIQYGKETCAALDGCNYFEMGSSSIQQYNFATLVLPLDDYLHIPLPQAQQIMDIPVQSQRTDLSFDDHPWAGKNWYSAYHLFVKCESSANSCVDCPVHSFSAAESDDISDCTCNSGFVGVAGGPCDIECAPGFEGDEAAEADACVACTAGKYKSSTGSGTCVSCPAHSTHTLTQQTTHTVCTCEQGFRPGDSAAGESYCAQCASGKFNNFAGETRCYDCAVATDGTSCSSISTVPAGMGVQGNNLVTCGAGSWNDGTYTACQLCPSPQTSSGPDGAHSEEECVCAAGYTRVAGECQACLQGQFKEIEGDDACVECSQSKFASTTQHTASTSDADCLCDAHFGWTGASCEACSDPAVKYVIADLPCVACAQHATLLDTVEHTAANCQCDPGYSGNKDTCEACAEGTYKADHGSLQCTECGPQTTSPSASTLISQCSCVDGYMHDQVEGGPDVEGGGCVAACNAGTSLSVNGVVHSACQECAGGTGIDSIGTYKSVIGSTACTECPDPRNASLPGATTQNDCLCMQGHVGLDPDAILRVAEVGTNENIQTYSLNNQIFNNQGHELESFSITSTSLVLSIKRNGISLTIMDCSGNCPSRVQLPAITADVDVTGEGVLSVFTEKALVFADPPPWLTDEHQHAAQQLGMLHSLTAGAVLMNTEISAVSADHCIACPPAAVCST